MGGVAEAQVGSVAAGVIVEVEAEAVILGVAEEHMNCGIRDVVEIGPCQNSAPGVGVVCSLLAHAQVAQGTGIIAIERAGHLALNAFGTGEAGLTKCDPIQIQTSSGAYVDHGQGRAFESRGLHKNSKEG